VIAANRGAPEG
jgi:hypothetical protein